MADVFLCPGLVNPKDVRLCPAGTPVVTYSYTGSGTLVLSGDAISRFVPAVTGGTVLWKPGRRRKKKTQPAQVFHYFATGRIIFSGSAQSAVNLATVWDEVIEAAWPELEALVEAPIRPIPPVIERLIESITITKRPPDDNEILLMLEALEDE